MSRVLIGALAVLALLSIGMGWLLHNEVGQRAVADLALQQAVAANQAGQQAITALAEQIAINHQAAIDARRRAAAERRRAEASASQLEEMKHANEDLRAYLRDPVHPIAARWMWLPASSDHQDGRTTSAHAYMAVGTDPETGQPLPIVDHETGWRWCKATDLALDACNQDKAAYLRAITAQEQAATDGAALAP